MRRPALLLTKRTATITVFMVVTLVVASGVALAVSKVGTNGRDTLTGTDKSDFLSGRGGGDDIYGWGGTDNLQGGPGKDFAFGGKRESWHFSSGNKNFVGGYSGAARIAPATLRGRKQTTRVTTEGDVARLAKTPVPRSC